MVRGVLLFWVLLVVSAFVVTFVVRNKTGRIKQVGRKVFRVLLWTIVVVGLALAALFGLTFLEHLN